MKLLQLASLAVAALPLQGGVASAQEVVELDDGRRFEVKELRRREGYVVFQTSGGRTFRVDEIRVRSPPLDTIPAEVLVLSDGRRLPVRQVVRRHGLVLFQTLAGRSFSVPEDRLLSPPLERIASLDAPAASAEAKTSPSAAPELQPPAPTPAATPPARAATWDEMSPLADRWSIPYPEDPRFPRSSWRDPYNQNKWKGDRPIHGDETFLVLLGALETPFEARHLPEADPASGADSFGRGDQLFVSPRLRLGAELFRGQTAFRPKTWAVRVGAVLSQSQLHVEPATSRGRTDVALDESHLEVKLAELSPRYDFVSLRAGVQPFVSDFRGFVFRDLDLGVRAYGNAGGNRWQYNAALFELLKKYDDTGLPSGGRRHQRLLVANVYRQDSLTPGLTLEASVQRLAGEETRAVYLGWAADGHAGRLNLSSAVYLARGETLAPDGASRSVHASMAALEASADRDWLRVKGSFFFASGDGDASDAAANGFDAVADQPAFAGGPFSFWTRSALALPSGATLKPSSSLLPSLRKKYDSEARFAGPGLWLVGIALDAALTPKLRAVAVANSLWFAQTEALPALAGVPGVRAPIGLDLGLGFQLRPLLSDNLVLSGGLTGLVPGSGLEDLLAGGGARQTGRLGTAFVQLKLAY